MSVAEMCEQRPNVQINKNNNSVNMEKFSYLLIESFALGVQENHLIERVLLSTNTDTCFGWKIRNLFLITYPCLMA